MEYCRSCHSRLGDPFLSLGNSPLSNSYLDKEHLGLMEPYYPLDVYFCEQCSLVQLDEFEKAQAIFSDDYAYYSSYSDSWLAHCKKYVDMMVKRFAIDSRWSVVEIASNDGYLLQYFKPHGVPVLGIEPARQAAQVAIDKGIPTETQYFTTAFGAKMAREGRSASLIIGNNVLAHNPNINDFVGGVAAALKPDGIVTMEFPHVLHMIEKIEFDTIYHEHFSYLSLNAVNILFERHGLSLFDVEELPTHGGSLRIFARHQAGGKRPTGAAVAAVLERERSAGIFSKEKYVSFAEGVRRVKRDLLMFLIAQKNAGKKVVGYGAPAKGNTLLNYCGIRTDLVEFTVDRNPHKQDHFLPGTHIPVKHPDAIAEARPDYILILPWNIKDEIVSQMAPVKSWGCRFVTAVPRLEVAP